jgi:hypothetical protein
VNLVASALLLLLVLRFLGRDDYVQWILFTTIAGGLIQLEQSLSTLVTRSISRSAAQGKQAFAHQLAAASRLYRRFAVGGVAVMFVGGAVYLGAADKGRFDRQWLIDWSAFCAAYLCYYFVGSYACSLIALDRADRHAAIGIVTRSLNVAVAGLLLLLGMEVRGLSVSVFVSFLAGAILFRITATHFVSHAGNQQLKDAPPASGSPAAVPVAQIGQHALYMLGSYALYRAGLLIEAAVRPDSLLQASYGLSLQLLALLATLASVPIVMRVAPLVRLYHQGEIKRAGQEIARLSLLVNLVFALGGGALILGADLIAYVSPEQGVALLPREQLAALTLAYAVEMNILILVNGLLAAQEFSFAVRYLLGAISGLAIGVIARASGAGFYTAFVLIPMAVQASVTLPAVFALLKRRYALGWGDYLLSILQHARRPSQLWH